MGVRTVNTGALPPRPSREGSYLRVRTGRTQGLRRRPEPKRRREDGPNGVCPVASGPAHPAAPVVEHARGPRTPRRRSRATLNGPRTRPSHAASTRRRFPTRRGRDGGERRLVAARRAREHDGDGRGAAWTTGALPGVGGDRRGGRAGASGPRPRRVTRDGQDAATGPGEPRRRARDSHETSQAGARLGRSGEHGRRFTARGSPRADTLSSREPDAGFAESGGRCGNRGGTRGEDRDRNDARPGGRRASRTVPGIAVEEPLVPSRLRGRGQPTNSGSMYSGMSFASTARR